MDIKDKFRPLQFKNVNASLSNKESIQTDCKAIKLLKKKKKSKVKIVGLQDKYSGNDSNNN